MAKKLGTLKTKRLFLGKDSGGRGTEVTVSAAELNAISGGTLTTDLTGDVTGDVLAGNTAPVVFASSTPSASYINAGQVSGTDFIKAGTELSVTTGKTPVNAVASVGLATFIDGSTQGETIAIGDDTYEIDIDAAGTTGGNFAIALTTGGGTTKEVAGTALTASIVANDTQGIGAGDNADGTVTLTADVKGVAGDAITLVATGAHIAVDAATMGNVTPGVDGTTGVKGEITWDATNIYICTLANTIADANWVQATMATF